MRTFINVLTTDTVSKRFTIDSYQKLTFTDKLTHITRQAIAIKYLKLVYGKDLWFLFNAYIKDIELELSSLSNKSKLREVINDNSLSKKLSDTITIVNNAINEPITSYPMNINLDDFVKYYGHSDIIPDFGDINFVYTLYTHLLNIKTKGSKKVDFDGKGTIIIPYNPMSKESTWKMISGQNYSYDIASITAHADKMDITVENILPFFSLLVSIKNIVYTQNIHSILALLSSFMIDDNYVNDYSGYITTYNNDSDKIKINSNKIEVLTKSDIPDTNSIIYKGCYRILFDEIENSVFNNINIQCQCTLNINQRTGLTKSVVDNRTSKNLLWLISYINNINTEFFNDNKIITRLITYFEPKVSPDNVSKLLDILHKIPHVTVEEYSFLAATNIGNLFKLSPFSEDDKEEEPEEDKEDGDKNNSDDNESSSESSDTDDPKSEDTEDTKDDEEATSEDSTTEEEPEVAETTEEPEVDTTTESTPEETEVDEDQAIPEYLLQLGSPPDLDNALYRLEMDRVITLILKNPPKSMSSETIKILTNVQSYWLHLLTLPTLKMILKKLIKS